MMDLDTVQSIEIVTSTDPAPVDLFPNLSVDFTKLPAIHRDVGPKMRRPVRPVDRQRMRPWLMELLDLGNVFGLKWTNRRQGIFQISWRHASRLGWNLETDGDVFERWARHTGIYKEGDPPEPKRWKANFRCALHSLHDVVELTNAVERRGRNACRTYRFLQGHDDQDLISKKKAKTKRTKDVLETAHSELAPYVIETSFNQELSDGETETAQLEKVIVQRLNWKSDSSGEDFSLLHDHDYAGPDKTQKTIVLRHGVGSVLLHKEIQSAPPSQEVESLLMSNLNQLASAAVNSAGIQSPLRQSYSWVPGGSDDSSVLETAMMLECDLPLTLEDSGTGNSANISKSSRTQTFVTVDELVGFSQAEDHKVTVNQQPYMCIFSQENLELETSPESYGDTLKPSSLRERTVSPKILCRKSKRGGRVVSTRTKAEPLMSSCLLLLEAATRLDHAEKGSSSSVFRSGSSKSASRKELPEDENDTVASSNEDSSGDDSVNSRASDWTSSEPSEPDVDDAGSHSPSNSSDPSTCTAARTMIRTVSLKPSEAADPQTSGDALDRTSHFAAIDSINQSELNSIFITGSKESSHYQLIQSKCEDVLIDEGVQNLGSSTRKLFEMEDNVSSKFVTDQGLKVPHKCQVSTFSSQVSTPSSQVSVSALNTGCGVRRIMVQKTLPVLSSSAQKFPSSHLGNKIINPFLNAQVNYESQGHADLDMLKAAAEESDVLLSYAENCHTKSSESAQLKLCRATPAAVATKYFKVQQRPALEVGRKVHIIDQGGTALVSMLESSGKRQVPVYIRQVAQPLPTLVNSLSETQKPVDSTTRKLGPAAEGSSGQL